MNNLYGLVAEKTEPDMIPENIRLGKTIWGVDWTLTPSFWTSWIGQSQYNFEWVRHTMPQYMTEIKYDGVIESSQCWFVVSGDYIICWIGYNGAGSPTYTAASFLKINLITWVVDDTVIIPSTVYNGFVSMKYENGIIYWNHLDSNPFHYEIDIVNRTISSAIAGYHTTWDDLPDTLTTWWKTFSASIIASYENSSNVARRGNSLASAFNWACVLLS